MYLISLTILFFTMIYMFMITNHPLTMGLSLLCQTLIICLLTGMMNKTFWFSYILYLIFLGGMLILFIYMTAIASNEMISFSIKTVFNFIIMMMLLSSMMLFMNWYFLNINKTLEMTPYNLNILLINENTLILNKIYNFPTNYLTLILINYLFLTLIIIVKITQNFYGPLRFMK